MRSDNASSAPAKAKKRLLLVIPPVLVLAVCVFHRQLAPLVKAVGDLYTCPFRLVTGIHCPGCGGTRSMLELMQGHLFRAIHDNPAAPALVLVLVLWYAEAVFAAFGKKVRLIPRSIWFWAIAAVLHLIWAILRLFIPEMLPLPLSSSLM